MSTSIGPTATATATAGSGSSPGATVDPLRLRVSPRPGTGTLDGAWWPRSRDLEAELAELVDHFPAEVGRVSRALFCRPDWLTQPRRVRLAERWMKTGFFPSDDGTHLVLLQLSYDEQLRLLVIPPDTTPARAEELMARAASPENETSGADLLTGAPQSRSADSTDHWSDDGGAFLRG